MTKRMLCLSLVAMLLVGLLPLSASAEEGSIGLRPLGDGESYSEMFVSRSMLDMIKDVEGFSPTPYWDVSQWTIGYGTACGYNWYDKPDLVVTREEAEKMLLMDVNDKYGAIVNDYCASIGRQPNQQQFDALVDFTYNLGGHWTRGCMLTDWLQNPTTELDLVNALGRWGRVNSVPSYSTCMRRIREAIVFLKGEYYLTYGSGSFETELTVIPNHDLPYYKVVIYDCDGGEIDGLSEDMSYHFAGQLYRNLPVPVREGYTFMGWQVTGERNSSVSEPYMLNRAMTVEENLNVVAIWKEGELETEPEPSIPEETEPETPDETTPGPSGDGFVISGTVRTNILNIRTGPGSSYELAGYLLRDDRVEIYARETVDGVVWGQIAEGWICLDYVDLDLMTGTVTASRLTIRSGAGSGYEALGYLAKGDRVEIVAQSAADDMIWGRIAEGWICLDYVALDDLEDTVPEATEPTEPAPTEPTEPEPTEPTEPEPEVPVLTGTVRAEKLTIRIGPGAHYESLGLLSRGDYVEIFEQTSADGLNWGRIAGGWICLDYVDLDAPDATEPEETIPEETEPEKEFPFEDVAPDAWYRDSVEYVYRNGYMNGLSESRFGPDESMTRAMLVTVLYRLAGEPEVTEDMLGVFEDVSESDYFHYAVAWAREQGIVNGVSDTAFAPNRKVTRQDAVTIFHRYFAGLAGWDGTDSGDLSEFADEDKVAAYAIAALEWAVETGMISGSASDLGMLLNPGAELTRAQAAKLMFMLDQLIEDMV